MSSRKFLFSLVVLAAVLIAAVTNLDAVMDIYSRNRTFSVGERSAREKRPSTQLARSLAHYTMGIIYDNEGSLENAIREYETVLKQDPNIGYVHTRLAVDYFMVKKIDKALEELKVAKALDPEDAKPRFLAALIYTTLNKFEEAQKEYEEVMRITPDSIWALSSLADIFVLQEKMGEAASVYEKLIEKEKESDLLYFNLGVI